jgi:hypothetical protein
MFMALTYAGEPVIICSNFEHVVEVEYLALHRLERRADLFTSRHGRR